MLENPRINIKIKLSALWTSVMFCYIYGDYFELYVPEKVEGMISGLNALSSPTSLFLASVLMAIPALMISLTIFLEPKINRWLNIIFGTLFTLLMITISITISAWHTFYVFLAILESLLTLLIVWYAWKWPKIISD